MKITSAKFLESNSQVEKCPPPNLPEYAFIGRSNVGKSSLINMIADNKKLAKTSGTPGKTQLINHFLINEAWYLVDLPGYGYAKVSKSKRKDFDKMITNYLEKRKNLVNVYLLIDSRHEPLKIDLEFMEYLGENMIPFNVVMTKIDKLSSAKYAKNLLTYQKKLLTNWEQLPQFIKTSATAKVGKDEILKEIEIYNTQLNHLDFRNL
ncbi:ribosome biogenesis GTP-binding protein YihA/YsxC [Candidatus Ornithobacterium hominis]|uniref:ribosome biogenesis GTP-binding protein YihA/YsxC n=1 Tax=Candidatus Ornithobacterium hominis TaxID=2497989 RepID=UPI0024BD2EED|nr:ribosome biogenesis GTP-binding protein YihA/YsxC [Candidatus Ornithobacterium hominis]CAI9428870.1 ribosome biogenesis GTP-binding protein YihA/YsxC [Candidatus Ornithobacterium hominis]